VGGKQDVVIVESPPIFLGITGLVLSWWRRARMIFNVSDLWPKSAVAMGVLRNEVLIRCALALEKCIYKHSYAITGQTEGIVEYIKHSVSTVPVSLITNGIDPEKFVNNGSERDKNRADCGFEGCFVVGFTGLHGLAYDFDGVLETAELLQSQSPLVLFAFFGDGPAKAAVQAAASERGLCNVRFFPPRPADAMPKLLSALDAAIIPLKNSEFFRNTLPSRLFECMAARLPVVLAILDGEATQIVRRSVGGLCVRPEDPCAMAEAIGQLASDRDLCVTLGQNGHRYVCLHYDRREMARRFLQLLPGNPAQTAEFLKQPSLAVQDESAE